MTVSPALLLGLLLSTAYAALFHFWGGRNLRDLLIYWLAAVIGFAAGQAIGVLAQISWLQIGQLYVFTGTIGALAALVVARAWSQVAFSGERLKIED